MPDAPLVLAADDDAEWRRLIEFSLQKAGFRVVLCENGAGVLPLACRQRPDVFVLDHDLGDMTGAELCRRIKAKPEFAEVPVVILTAVAGALPAMLAGCPPDHFVSKTGGIDELTLVLGGLFPPPV
ncbi:MAG: response regulator [Elusimicrobia bacterium]|nr:response regulator [Elusimicrobiota bacterium]